MKRQIASQVWIILGSSAAVVAGLILLLAFLGQGAGPPAQSAPPPSTPAPIIASVNGEAIEQSTWQQAYLLDQVLSTIAGQTAPTPEETLQQLINQALILSAAPPIQPPTAEQVADKVDDFQAAWNLDEEALDEALNTMGLTREVFEQTIQRQLNVQAGMESLESQGEDVQAWLAAQREQAEIVIHGENMTLPEAVAQAAATLPATMEPAVVIASPLPTPTPEPTLSPPTPTPTPESVAIVPETAPNFTLERADGGDFTLTEQLTRGPVVLVFFQRCG